MYMTLCSDGEIKVWTSQFGQPPPTPPPAEIDDDRTVRTTKSKAHTEGGDTDDATRTRRRLSHVTANMSMRRNSDTTQLTNFTNPDMKSNKHTSSNKHLSVKSVLDALHDESSDGSLSEAPSEQQLLQPLLTSTAPNTSTTDEVPSSDPRDKNHSHQKTNKQALLHRFRIHTKAITGIILHKLPHCVISSSLDGFLKILDLEEFTVIGSYDLGHRISDLQLIMYDSKPCCLLGLDYRFIRVWAMSVLAEKVLSYDEDVMRFNCCVALHSPHIVESSVGASAAVDTAVKVSTSADQASPSDRSSGDDGTSASSSRSSSNSDSDDSDAKSNASSPTAIDVTAPNRYNSTRPTDSDTLLAVLECRQAYVVETSHELCVYNRECKLVTYIEQTQVLEGVISCQVSLTHQILFVLFKNGLVRVYSLVSSPATVLSSVLLGDVLHSPSQGSSAKHLHPTTSIRYTAMSLIDTTPIYDSSVVHMASKETVHSHAHSHMHEGSEMLVIGSQSGYIHFFKTGGHGAPSHHSSFSVLGNSPHSSSSSSSGSYSSSSSHYISSIQYQPNIKATTSNTTTSTGKGTSSNSGGGGTLFILLSPTQPSTDNTSIIQIWTMPEINRASVIEIISITSMSCFRVAPLSNIIACGCRDGSLYLYTYDSHLKLMSTYNQVNNNDYSSGVSSSGGRDGGRECIGYNEIISDSIQSHDDEVIDIAFSSYYQLYTSCSRDMTVKIWSFRKELLCNLTFESISMSVSFYGTGSNTTCNSNSIGDGAGESGNGGSGTTIYSINTGGLDILITQSSHVSVIASSVWNKSDKTFPTQTTLAVDNNTSVSTESQGVVVERDTEYNMVASHVAALPPTSAVGSYRSPRTRNAILKQPHSSTITIPTSKVNESRLPSFPDSVPGPDPSIPIVSTATTTATIDPPSSTSEALLAGVGVPVYGLGEVRTGPTIKETLSTAIHKPWEKRQRMFKIRSADINDAEYKASWSLYIQQKNKYTKNIQTVPVTVLK